MKQLIEELRSLEATKIKKKENLPVEEAKEMDVGMKLPKELSKMSKAQQKKVINHMSKWPLKKLRKHQEIVQKQKSLNYKEAEKLGFKNLPKEIELAGDNLDVMDKIVMAAIDKKEFGESKKEPSEESIEEQFIGNTGKRGDAIFDMTGKVMALLEEAADEIDKLERKTKDSAEKRLVQKADDRVGEAWFLLSKIQDAHVN